MKKMLSEHKMMIRPTRVDSDLQAAALRDESLTKDVLSDMSKVMKKNRSEDERVSALLHMEDMLQFMLLREQLREFKQRRQDNLREKMRYSDHIREEINNVIVKQSSLQEKQIKLKERISRHFLIAGLLWFPGMPILLGLSLMLGTTFAPVFLVGIFALAMTVVMGEKIVHDYQHKEALYSKIEEICQERSKLIKMYMQHRHEIKSLIEDQPYYIEKFSSRIMRGKDYFH